MTSEQFLQQFVHFTDAPNGVSKLRELILTLAITGRLVHSEDETESLKKAIEREKSEVVKSRRLKRHPPSPPFSPEELSVLPPENWLICRLGDLVYSRKTSYGDNLSPDLVSAGVVKVGNISNDGFFKGDFSKRGFSKQAIGELLCNAGDILVVKSSGSAENVHSGKAALCGLKHDGKIVGSNFVLCLRRFGESVVPEYLWRVLISPISRAWVNKTVQTMTYPNLKWSDYSQLPVSLPSAPEQERIVAKVDELMTLCDQLEAARDAREKTHQRLIRAIHHPLTETRDNANTQIAWRRIRDNFANLYTTLESVQAFRRVILQLAVQGNIVPQDSTDEPASVTLEKIKNEKTQMLKEGLIRKGIAIADIGSSPLPFGVHATWEWVTFDEIVNVVGGVTKGRNLQGRETAHFPYLRVANVQRGRLDLGEIKEIEIPTDELGKYRLEKGDLLITEGGDWDKVGRTAIWHGEIETCLHQNHVFRARVISESIDRRYLMMYLNSPVSREYFAGSSKQTTNLASINMTQLRSAPIPIPPKEEQSRIVAKVDELMTFCDELESQIKARSDTAVRYAEAATHQMATA